MGEENLSKVLDTMKRITVIDALRGVVLIGICMVHGLQHFGAPFLSNAEPSSAWIETMNEATRWMVSHFVMGKFYIIFSFLFGLSFFIQMDRAAKKGIDFRGRFLWRLTLLFTIGLLHSAIFRHDILIVYALLGVPLVLMYRIPSKVLLAIAVFLFMGGVQLTTIGYNAAFKPAEKEIVESSAPRGQRPRPLSLDGSISENVKDNITNGLVQKFKFQFGVSGRGYITMGFFLLGLLAGRIRLFNKLDQYRSYLYRGAWAALVVLLSLYQLQSHLPRGEMGNLAVWSVIQLSNTINLLSAYLWVVVVIWAYRNESVQRFLSKVVSYGQMGLTNYIAQSVVGVFLFYGFGAGLYPWGTFFSVMICLAYTVVQIQVSYYWLKRFRYGPIEWLWRSGTYLKWQPLRRALD